MSKLRPLGCLAFMLLDESKRKKLDTKSQKCILLANLDHGNYRLLDLSTRKVMSVDMSLSSRINSLLVHSLASLSMACTFQLLLKCGNEH
jgi:hypothetical protein